MSEAKPTPGPLVYGDWVFNRVGQEDSAGWVEIWSEAGGERGLPVVSCKHSEQIANARLFCAAMPLLDALRDCVALIERDMPGDRTSQPELIAARAAIAAATN